MYKYHKQSGFRLKLIWEFGFKDIALFTTLLHFFENISHNMHVAFCNCYLIIVIIPNNVKLVWHHNYIFSNKNSWSKNYVYTLYRTDIDFFKIIRRANLKNSTFDRKCFLCKIKIECVYLVENTVSAEGNKQCWLRWSVTGIKIAFLARNCGFW